jgi:RNase P subunit RPR2
MRIVITASARSSLTRKCEAFLDVGRQLTLIDRSYAPHYDKSFTGIMICFVVCFVCAEILRFILARENKRREAQYGPPDDAQGLDDFTDRENKSFRYHL